MQAPTAAELLANRVVRQALEDAWAASEPSNPENRHEEGGWIYMDLKTAEIKIRRAPRGARAEIFLDSPPEVSGAVVVGIFHTHPNPTAEGWDSGPSADNGIHVSGPQSRRGGLAGGPGYPP
jgi:hypothetical protein